MSIYVGARPVMCANMNNIIIWASLMAMMAIILFFSGLGSVGNICNGVEYVIYDVCDTPIRSFTECRDFALKKHMLMHSHVDEHGVCFVDARDNTVRFVGNDVSIPVSFFEVCKIPSKAMEGITTFSEAMNDDVRMRTLFVLWILGCLMTLVEHRIEKLILPLIFFLLCIVTDDAQLHMTLVSTGVAIFFVENTYYIIVARNWFCGLLTIAYVVTGTLYVRALAEKHECDNRYALEYVTLFVMGLSTSHIAKKNTRRAVDNPAHYEQLV